ncbi:MAG: hypothetical protein COY75_03925 [Nitrospirae bacterium CG_4_10_14_0_8_um_filter_41_23]|nr:helix-turn-helix domain-containing protein [Nitrospirota bacterium]PIQ93654.1 MAG: hypothetical protein COV68_08695 [Nitrospirae bacterium CG11_big_fil_rev_8_21_14_0_20_41_14]PIV44343.1 MAG: hypothetical protein COS27_02070 [Nitrospirae bacterium CG02_land_8_20_14_3_00_41_53]PIW87401.1 MAG: hypothetical protein COZ94_05385 [Nitrospirae bacterium CG_4_8_14_3_um_filter_41_47]PIY87219.1 MAG: hypothetical protein COY75_03925 [Nitrospirae bacterium CG_4_10_14_0_8_um_filter_41_23]PJA79541.1 MAG: 
MKTELEAQDIEAIAQRVAELLKPAIIRDKKQEDDVIFNVHGLAQYLNVTPKWIYEQTYLKTIPHYKLTNKQLRFKKEDINKWLNTLRRPATGKPMGKLRLIK